MTVTSSHPEFLSVQSESCKGKPLSALTTCATPDVQDNKPLSLTLGHSLQRRRYQMPFREIRGRERRTAAGLRTLDKVLIIIRLLEN